jgi:hypothetical protein
MYSLNISIRFCYLGYKTHRDCTLNGLKQDRYATFLIYLNTVMEGGETEFQGKHSFFFYI